MAGGLGGRRGLHHSEPRAGGGRLAPAVRARDAAVPVRRSAHGARQELHDRRCALPSAPPPRPARAAPHGLRRVRPAGRERRDPRGPPPARRHERQYRRDPQADEAHGLVDRLVARAVDRRARVLPLDAVDLPAAVRARPGQQARGARSTGARSIRRCSPTSRSSTATASAAARSSRAARWRSGTSRSPTTPSGCWTTWNCSRTGPSACSRCSATGSAAPRVPRCSSTSAIWRPRSASSRRGRTRSTARRSSSWRRSIR